MRVRWSGWVWVEGSWRKVCEAASRNRCASELVRRGREAGVRDRSLLALCGDRPPDWAPQSVGAADTVSPDSEASGPAAS